VLVYAACKRMRINAPETKWQQKLLDTKDEIQPMPLFLDDSKRRSRMLSCASEFDETQELLMSLFHFLNPILVPTTFFLVVQIPLQCLVLILFQCNPREGSTAAKLLYTEDTCIEALVSMSK